MQYPKVDITGAHSTEKKKKTTFKLGLISKASLFLYPADLLIIDDFLIKSPQRF